MGNNADQLKEYRNNLISFIEYLYDYRSDMKDDINTINMILNIHYKQHCLNQRENSDEQYRLKPRESYEDAVKFKNLQSRKEKELDNLIFPNLITSKAKELKLYENSTIEIRNNLNPACHLMYDIRQSEVTAIIEAKNKYLTFRKDTDFCDFLTGSFFYDLDKALIEFFGAFTDVSDMKRTQPEPPAPQAEADPREDEMIANNFNDDDIENVLTHFQSLEKYMNNGEFMQWIKHAFELQQLPEHKFSLKGKYTLTEIRRLFYTYWRKRGKHGNRNDYVKLLSDYFVGFPFKTTLDNFNK